MNLIPETMSVRLIFALDELGEIQTETVGRFAEPSRCIPESWTYLGYKTVTVDVPKAQSVEMRLEALNAKERAVNAGFEQTMAAIQKQRFDLMAEACKSDEVA